MVTCHFSKQDVPNSFHKKYVNTCFSKINYMRTPYFLFILKNIVYSLILEFEKIHLGYQMKTVWSFVYIINFIISNQRAAISVSLHSSSDLSSNWETPSCQFSSLCHYEQKKFKFSVVFYKSKNKNRTTKTRVSPYFFYIFLKINVIL